MLKAIQREMDSRTATAAPSTTPPIATSRLDVPAVYEDTPKIPEPVSAEDMVAETYQDTLRRLRRPLQIGTARDFNFRVLVNERKRHETHEAQSAITYRYNHALATGALQTMQESGSDSGAAGKDMEIPGGSGQMKAQIVSQLT